MTSRGAYDQNILGVTPAVRKSVRPVPAELPIPQAPQLKVDVRLDVLEEKDGPMLQWGLQHFHGAELHVPRRPELRPNLEFVASRYAAFQKAR